MKQSIRVTKRQLALWSEHDEQIQPTEQTREEATRVLADLLLQAMGVRLPAGQKGGDDESEDLA